MKVKAIKRENGTYIRLPDDLRGAEELELFMLRDGYYLLSIPLDGKKEAKGAPEPETAGGLSSFEMKVLQKLAGIRFGKRVPMLVNREFSRQEREALLSLKKKGAVTIIKSKKYPGGVYNIQNEFYPAQKKEPAEERGAADLEKQLFRDGYITVADAQSAQRLSDILQRQKNAVTGVKSFDGKYYVVTRAHMEKVKKLLARWRGEYVDPKALGAKFGIHPDAAKAVLKILAEGGEYMEKGEVFLKVE